MNAALSVAALALAATACNQVFGLDPIGDRDAFDGDSGVDDGGGLRDARRDGGAGCGDGVVDPDGGANEQCDDGGTESGDGCSSTCQFEYAVIGCSDGVRDGFLDLASSPDVAACAGRWTEMGIARQRVGTNCGRAGDDTGIFTGCAAADLCAAGWRVCQDDDVASPNCPETTGFWAANAACSGATFVIGCSLDVGATLSGCSPFDRTLGASCVANSTAGWTCSPGVERTSVIHDDDRGGVLCCRT